MTAEQVELTRYYVDQRVRLFTDKPFSIDISW